MPLSKMMLLRDLLYYPMVLLRKWLSYQSANEVRRLYLKHSVGTAFFSTSSEILKSSKKHKACPPTAWARKTNPHRVKQQLRLVQIEIGKSHLQGMWFSRCYLLDWGSKCAFLTSSPGDAHAAGPGITLWEHWLRKKSEVQTYWYWVIYRMSHRYERDKLGVAYSGELL